MDAMMEEECFRTAQNAIIISYDDEYYSGVRRIPSKPVMSSSKASTCPPKHKSYNEETPLEKLIKDPSHRNKKL